MLRAVTSGAYSVIGIQTSKQNKKRQINYMCSKRTCVFARNVKYHCNIFYNSTTYHISLCDEPRLITCLKPKCLKINCMLILKLHFLNAAHICSEQNNF